MNVKEVDHTLKQAARQNVPEKSRQGHPTSVEDRFTYRQNSNYEGVYIRKKGKRMILQLLYLLLS